MIEKIKKNKLRSACIGLSAFLFGFITVTIFNNINDTYAVAYYTCPSGWYLADATGSGKCCPNGARKYTGRCEAYYDNPANYYNCEKGYELYLIEKNPVNFACYFKPKDADKHETHSYSITFNANAPLSGSYKATWTSPGSGYYSEGTVITLCDTKPGLSTCQITSLPTISRTGYSMVGWSTSSSCSAIANLRVPRGLGRNLTFYACWEKKDACYICGTSQGGAYVWGKYAGNSSCNIQSNYQDIESCINNNPNPDDVPVIDTGGYTGGTVVENPTESATTINYYKIVYDLDGGKLIDGKTSKTQYVRGDKSIGIPKTNPIKDGYAFIEWTYNDNSFSLETKLDEVSGLSEITENDVKIKTITLKAKYEKLDYSELKCKDSSAILDPTTRKCYTVLKENSSDNIFTHTTYSYKANALFCYANGVNGQPGGIFERNETSCSKDGGNGCTTTGRDNATGGEYDKYSNKDAWLSNTSCFITASCTKSESASYNECSVTWDSIVYNISDAIIEEKEIPKEDIDLETPDDNQNNDDDKQDDSNKNNDEDNKKDDKTNEELDKNSKTGDVLIFIAWTIGIGALAYSVYYFKSRKETI